jgi:hypothetical protein
MEQVFDIITSLKIRKVSIEDAGSLHSHCFPSETLEEVEKKLKRDIERMDRGEAHRMVAEINGYAVGTYCLSLTKKTKK